MHNSSSGSNSLVVTSAMSAEVVSTADESDTELVVVLVIGDILVVIFLSVGSSVIVTESVVTRGVAMVGTVVGPSTEVKISLKPFLDLL